MHIYSYFFNAEYYARKWVKSLISLVRFLIGRLEQYEDIEFPSKVVPKIPAACIDTGAVKAEGNRDEIKKEEKSRTVGPPPALLGPFPTSKHVYQQEDSGTSNAGEIIMSHVISIGSCETVQQCQI